MIIISVLAVINSEQIKSYDHINLSNCEEADQMKYSYEHKRIYKTSIDRPCTEKGHSVK